MNFLVAPHFSGTGLQIENFRENVSFSWLRVGQLWNQISRVLLVFCSGYTYSLERVFSQLSNDVFDYPVTFAVFELEGKRLEKLVKKYGFLTFWSMKVIISNRIQDGIMTMVNIPSTFQQKRSAYFGVLLLEIFNFEFGLLSKIFALFVWKKVEKTRFYLILT
jgi:hypothetical protein